MLIPSGWAQVNWIFTGIGCPQGAEVTMGLDYASFPGTVPDAAEACHDAWEANVLPVQCDGVTLTNTRVKIGPNASGLFADFASSDNGGLSIAQQPPQVAILVNKVTGVGGRPGRGRMYIPGASDTDVDADGSLQTPYLAAWQSALDDLRTDLIAADLEPSLLHGDSSPAPTPYAITQLQVAGLVATQRRRLRG